MWRSKREGVWRDPLWTMISLIFQLLYDIDALNTNVDASPARSCLQYHCYYCCCDEMRRQQYSSA